MKLVFAQGVKALALKMPNGVSRKLFRTALVAKKNSPAMLFGAGVVGTVGTVVLACRATLQLNEKLESIEKRRMDAQEALSIGAENYTEKDYQREMRLARIELTSKVFKLYGPAVLLGVGSVAALTGSHVILTKRNTGLMAAYAGLDKVFNSYRKRVIAELGEEKDKEFRHGYEIKEFIKEGENGPEKEYAKRHTGEPEGFAVLFSRDTSKQWRPEHMYNQNFLKHQQLWATDLLRQQGHLFLNDVYKMLGMPQTSTGAVAGWIYENEDINPGDSYVDFGIFRNDIFVGQLFVNGDEQNVWIDFNCAPIYHLIDEVRKRKRNKK